MGALIKELEVSAMKPVNYLSTFSYNKHRPTGQNKITVWFKTMCRADSVLALRWTSGLTPG